MNGETKELAGDAFKVVLLMKTLGWPVARCKKALQSILESYRIYEEAERARIKH